MLFKNFSGIYLIEIDLEVLIMHHDYRTKPQHQWTFYVVDDLPKMSNLYRYDTVEEAIEKYKSLPDDKVKAIGSSIHNLHEVDHIHCRNGHNVLVMDSERSGNSIWRESSEIQNAIDQMIAYLNVQHQLSNMFGNPYPSVIVDLERYKEREIDPYFGNKLLRPENPENLLTAIKEVYVEDKGWMEPDPFLCMLYDSRPSRMGEAAKSNFVTRLNIDYIDDTGRCGQADISTLHFTLLQEKTVREVSPEKLAADLYQFSKDVDPYEAQDQQDIQDTELEAMRKDIASGSLHSYIKYLKEGLEEGFSSEEEHKKALSLLSRLTVLTPKEFRKPALVSMIQNAENKAKEQQRDPSRTKSTGLEL